MTTMSDAEIIAWAKHVADVYTNEPDLTLSTRYRRLADLAEKGAESSVRDPFTDPRRGDWFIDPEGDIVEVTATPRFVPHVWRTDKRVTTPGLQTAEEFGRWVRGAGCRVMTAEEVIAFNRDGTRPLPAPPGGGR